MPVLQFDGVFSFVRISLAPAEVAKLLVQHRSRYPKTKELEQSARHLIAANFPSSASADFITEVCKWGRGERHISRIHAAGEIRIAYSLKSAMEAIETDHVTQALEKLQGLPQLGLSFASKVARFLAPHKCVVLDSVIRSRVGYVESNEGYAEFLNDCSQLLTMLRTSPDLEASLRDGLRVCDVEAAVFMKAKKNVSS
ncbi:hypothetical protein AB9E15_15700 [Rhizobium leguminosarum]|uniref:8-oxoguanine DNA glycosylase OGG fold protein n=1 Tax=Rhizobium leguminosarum TaxID=384 RepID=UPI003F950EE2